MITLVILSVIVAAMMSVLFSVYKETGVVLSRRDVLGQGQISMQQMTKQFRQAQSIISSSATTFSVNTYMGAGTAHQIAWRTAGSSAPYSLQEQIDGGSFKTVFKSLTSPNIFTYSDSDPTDADPIDHVSIKLSLGTNSATVSLDSDVEMRNL